MRWRLPHARREECCDVRPCRYSRQSERVDRGFHLNVRVHRGLFPLYELDTRVKTTMGRCEGNVPAKNELKRDEGVNLCQPWQDCTTPRGLHNINRRIEARCYSVYSSPCSTYIGSWRASAVGLAVWRQRSIIRVFVKMSGLCTWKWTDNMGKTRLRLGVFLVVGTRRTRLVQELVSSRKGEW